MRAECKSMVDSGNICTTITSFYRIFKNYKKLKNEDLKKNRKDSELHCKTLMLSDGTSLILRDTQHYDRVAYLRGNENFTITYKHTYIAKIEQNVFS